MTDLEKFNTLTDENKCRLFSSSQFPYELNKLLAWQDKSMLSDESVSWEVFNSRYFQCHNCGYWDDNQCICYAR